MKESDRIQAEIDNLKDDDNDFKYLNLSTKLIRAKRAEKFDKYIHRLREKGFEVIEIGYQGKITIQPTNYGIIDYYPKANKILIRMKNKWVTGGLQWIIKNLLK
jgi:hypothetical protein